MLGLNSGPNASIANSSVTEHSPQPPEHLHYLWKGKEEQVTLALGQTVGQCMGELSGIHRRVLYTGTSLAVNPGLIGVNSPESLYPKQENRVRCP